MINERYIHEFCNGDVSKIENYNEALEDTTQTWHCHHRRETDGEVLLSKDELIEMGLYYDRPPNELILLTKHEHMKLHCSLRNLGNDYMRGKTLSQEIREKISKGRKGKSNGRSGTHLTDETKSKISNSHKGKHLSEETKKKIGEKISTAKIGNTNVRGMKWFNNGIRTVRAYECPDGFTQGRIIKK